MARKEAPRIDPISLYEEKVVYIIEILERTLPLDSSGQTRVSESSRLPMLVRHL